MRASVVINTYNRANSLPNTLRGLRQQTHDDFEVVVVKGPCTDDTDAVLAEFPGVRVADCPVVKLSRSRNIGISAAAGEAVAFIDDDSIPEPNWLRDLLAAYAAPDVGAAGGLVYDPSGFALQYRYAACDRTGDTDFDVMPPFDDYVRTGADPFVYLQGTNTSFRRSCLQEIGGFDEEIEYYYDDVEVCLQVIDRGRRVAPLTGAGVHHKCLASTMRNHKRVIFNPFTIIKDRHYFALQNGTRTRPLDAVLAVLARYAALMRASGEAAFRAGDLTEAQLGFYLEQLERGVRTGLDRGLNATRFRREIPPADPDCFVPYPTLRPEGRRLTVCLLSRNYPPDDCDVGRHTCDLATGLAALGHAVHVVTRSPDVDRVDLEGGVWLHRLADAARCPAALSALGLVPYLESVAGAYHEVCRIHERGPVDVVGAPLSMAEGLLCSLDGRFPTVLSLMTSPRALGEEANTLAYHAGRYPRTRPVQEARPARVGRMVREFASILAEVTGAPHDAALKMAQSLLSPHQRGLGIDYLTHIQNLLHRPPAKFVSELYRLLLGRDETPQELADGVRDLARGVAPGRLVQKLATSEEAQQLGLPTAGWLPRAMAAGGVPNVSVNSVPAAPRGRLARARALAGRLPLAGKAARYLKRLILLPWNFAKLYQAFQEQQHATRELLHAQQRELCDALSQQSCELRTVLGAQLHDLRAEIARPPAGAPAQAIGQTSGTSAPEGDPGTRYLAEMFKAVR